jgi:hypothetical protein
MTGAALIAAPEPLATQAEPVATRGLATQGLATQGNSTKPDPTRTYSCPECEHVLRVSGLGRHRVYFESSDAWSHNPVMNRVCPACGHGLPGKSPR